MSKRQSVVQQKIKSLETRQDLNALRALASMFFASVMAVLPLYVTQSKYTRIIGYKTDFFLTITAVFSALAAVFLISCGFRLRDYYVKDGPKRPVSLPEWTVLAFALLTLLSAALSSWQSVVWKGFSGRYEGFWAFLCYCAAFVFIARLYRPKGWHMLIAAGACVIISLYGLMQFMGFDPLKMLVFTDAGILQGNGRPLLLDEAGNAMYGPLSSPYRTSLGNSNVIAAYCSITAVLFAALFAGEKSKRGFLHLAASVMAFVLLLISNGDGGKIGVLGGMALCLPYWISNRERLAKILLTMSGWSAAYAIFHGALQAYKAAADIESLPVYERQFLTGVYAAPPDIAPFIVLAVILLGSGLLLTFAVKKWPENGLKKAGVIFLGASLAGGVLFVEIAGARLADNPGNIVYQAREILHGNLQDGFGTNRGWVWKRGLSVIPENPLLGTGPDTFYYALGEELQSEAVERYNVMFDKAHNTYIQIAVCLGVPALAAFLAMLAGLFIPAVKAAFDRPLLLAFGAASLSYLIQCFFEIDMPIDKPMMWVSLGVMAGELWRGKLEKAELSAEDGAAQ